MEDGEYILITIPLPEATEYTDALRKEYPSATIAYHQVQMSDTTAPADVFAPATILYTLYAMPAAVEHAPRLKWVHFYGAGIDRSVSAPHWTSTAIPFTTNSGAAAPQIAELALLAEAANRRRLPALTAAAARASWAAADPAVMPHLLSARSAMALRVGVFGYGAIGRQLARLAAAQGARVFAHTASPRPDPASRASDAPTLPGMGDPEGVLPEAWTSGSGADALRTFLAAPDGAGLDWLVVCAPLTPATTGAFGPAEFALLARRRAFFTNVARGELVDQPALAAALRPGPDGAPSALRGAHVDVASPEPLPSDSELWRLDNCLVTPHVAAVVADYPVRAYAVFGENLRRFVKGERLVNLVSRKTGY